MQGATSSIASHSKTSGFLSLIKTNWIVILGLIFAVPMLYRYIKEQMLINKKTDENIKASVQILEMNDPQKRKKAANIITLDTRIQKSAEDLAHHLGTKYNDTGDWSGWLDPKGWTENDGKVYDILWRMVNNIHTVERLYHDVYTRRRNLKDDVNKLLDDKELTQLKNFYKKYSKTW